MAAKSEIKAKAFITRNINRLIKAGLFKSEQKEKIIEALISLNQCKLLGNLYTDLNMEQIHYRIIVV